MFIVNIKLVGDFDGCVGRVGVDLSGESGVSWGEERCFESWRSGFGSGVDNVD